MHIVQQYSNISYMPVPTSNFEPLTYHYVNDNHQLVPNMTAIHVPPSGPTAQQHQLSTLPISYSLTTGLSTGFETSNGGMMGATQYVINQPDPIQYGGDGGVGGGMAIHQVHMDGHPHHLNTIASPYHTYTSYHHQRSQNLFNTLQHPRRVRVLPPSSNNNVSISPSLGSPATTHSMTSSVSTSLATNVHQRTSNDQLSRSPMTDV